MHFYVSGGDAGDEVYEMHFETSEGNMYGPHKNTNLKREHFSDPKIIDEFGRSAEGTGSSYFIYSPSRVVPYKVVLLKGVEKVCRDMITDSRHNKAEGITPKSPIEALLNSVKRH